MPALGPGLPEARLDPSIASRIVLTERKPARDELLRRFARGVRIERGLHVAVERPPLRGRPFVVMIPALGPGFLTLVGSDLWVVTSG